MKTESQISILVGRSALSGVIIGIAANVFNEILFTNLPYARIIACIFFSLALLCVIELKLPLFTGRVGCASTVKDHTNLALILFGNIIGCLIMYGITVGSGQTRGLYSNEWLNLPLKNLFFSAVACGIIIEFCVQAKRPVIVLLLVATFLLLGYRHSIADTSNILINIANFSARDLLVLAVIILGNSFGAKLIFMLKPTT